VVGRDLGEPGDIVRGVRVAEFGDETGACVRVAPALGALAVDNAHASVRVHEFGEVEQIANGSDGANDRAAERRRGEGHHRSMMRFKITAAFAEMALARRYAI
jgi:hypothetical protein